MQHGNMPYSKAHALGANPTVDAHSHAMPLRVLKELERMGLADMSEVAQERVVLAPEVSGLPPNVPIPFPAEQHDVEARLGSMDEAGIGVDVILPPPFLFAAGCSDNDIAARVVSESNEGIAEFVSRAPSRLIGFGSVPLGRPSATKEAIRCLDELGLAGFTIGTSGGGRELDAVEHYELWELLEDRKCLIFLHPNGGCHGSRLRDYHLTQLLGYPAETALGVGRLIFGGVLDRFDLTLGLAHGGGSVHSIAGRLDLGWERKAVAQTCTYTPSSYLNRFYYDTAVFDRKSLQRLVDDVGGGRVLLGTDRPFDLAERDPVARVTELDVDPETISAILGGNACDLLGIER